MTICGPHCSHDECSWVTCDDSGLVEFPCHQAGCTYCGAPEQGSPEQWAGDSARVAAMSPQDQARVQDYLSRYPLVRRGADDSYERYRERAETLEYEEDYDPDDHYV